ncbi:uncharacterized protein (TIGR02117 family) [Mucilaginibacter gracilis]|uniref:Uncharacterized protein (TIGR02117 family) n=1 Tax=Mucilaginibacter gracilis TaxID=423350 RepID=A0A495J3S6_9SPHI|nr:TIGR02117 family protein [Mucilaginibacter gracilis]RKR83004.1 uncharacterized protein (TIGR02117 family) [Mucilaginibacter gracilis]
MFRVVLRRLLFIVLAFVGILGTYAILALLLPHIKVNRNFTETPNGVTIFVCSNGVHTDVAVPVNTTYIDWRKQFNPASFKAVDSSFQYIEIGWGDKAFFLNTPTWADLKFSTAINALFYLDSSAMHVTYDKFPPKVTPKFCQKIVISPQQYRQLIAYVQNSFNLHSGQVAVFPGRGYDVTDNFYEANGRYSFAKTCNVWTSGALKAAGIQQGLWSPFESGVMDGYKYTK